MSLDTKTVIKKGTERFKAASIAAIALTFVGWLLYDLGWYNLVGGGPESLVVGDNVLAGLLFLTGGTLILATCGAIVRQYRSDTTFLDALSYEGPKKTFYSSLAFGSAVLIYLFVTLYFDVSDLLAYLLVVLPVLAGTHQFHRLKDNTSRNKDWIVPKVRRNREELKPVALRFLGLLVLTGFFISFVVLLVADPLTRFLVENGLYTVLTVWGMYVVVEVLDQLD